MLDVSELGILNCYTLFRLILLTLFVSRNPTLIHLPLFGSLDSLLCDLIAVIAVWFFSTNVADASDGVIIFVRLDLSFSELSTSSLSSLDPYSDYVGINISLNNSSLLSFLNVYATPIRSSPKDSRTNSFSPCGTALSNCSLCGTEATLFFSAGQVFPLKPGPFCKLFASFASTNKSATSLLLLYDSRSVLATLSFPPSFLLP